MSSGLRSIGGKVGKKKHTRRTFREVKERLRAQKLRPLVNYRVMHQYADQAEFSQVGKGTRDQVNEILQQVLEEIVKHAMLSADADGKKSLSRQCAIRAISKTKLVPPGHYE